MLHIVVQPGARRDEVVGWQGDALKVRVRAAPEHGRANRAVVDLIAVSLGVPISAVEVVSGHASRSKRVRVLGCGAADVAAVFGSPPGSAHAGDR
ncbi:MAG: DUF167 domain-containing protein [Actinomycetota bacterium]|nr:DUF167 domain-containing protein [Actinomycetota bacterium]